MKHVTTYPKFLFLKAKARKRQRNNRHIFKSNIAYQFCSQSQLKNNAFFISYLRDKIWKVHYKPFHSISAGKWNKNFKCWATKICSPNPEYQPISESDFQKGKKVTQKIDISPEIMAYILQPWVWKRKQLTHICDKAMSSRRFIPNVKTSAVSNFCVTYFLLCSWRKTNSELQLKKIKQHSKITAFFNN